MNKHQKEAFLSCGRQALIAEKLQGLVRVEVKARSLPHQYLTDSKNDFPREDSYCLAEPDTGYIRYWVPGHINDCFVINEESGYVRHVPMPPHYFDDDAPVREMETQLWKKSLEKEYVGALVEIVDAECRMDDRSVWGALMTATNEQRGKAALKALKIEVPEWVNT